MHIVLLIGKHSIHYCKVTIEVHGKLLVLIAYSYAICLICLDVDKWLLVVRL